MQQQIGDSHSQPRAQQRMVAVVLRPRQTLSLAVEAVLPVFTVRHLGDDATISLSVRCDYSLRSSK